MQSEIFIYLKYVFYGWVNKNYTQKMIFEKNESKLK